MMKNVIQQRKRNNITYIIAANLLMLIILVSYSYYAFYRQDSPHKSVMLYYKFTLVKKNKIVEYYVSKITDNGGYKENIEWRYDVKRKKITSKTITYFKKHNQSLLLLRSSYDKKGILYFTLKNDTMIICHMNQVLPLTITHQYLNKESMDILGNRAKVYKFFKIYHIMDGTVANAYYDQNFDLLKEVSLDDNEYDYVKEITNSIPEDFLKLLKKDYQFHN